MKYRLRIKQLPNGNVASGGVWIKAEDLPESALLAKRKKIIPGEIFEVGSKEAANEYLNSGMIEVVSL